MFGHIGGHPDSTDGRVRSLHWGKASYPGGGPAGPRVVAEPPGTGISERGADGFGVAHWYIDADLYPLCVCHLLQRFPCRAQVLAGFNHPSSHVRFGGLTPGAWIVFRLVANAAVDLEHTVVVFKHVGRDRASERVLSVSIDVHFDDAVGHGIGDVLGRRTRTPVEDQVKWTFLAKLGTDFILDFFE